MTIDRENDPLEEGGEGAVADATELEDQQDTDAGADTEPQDEREPEHPQSRAERREFAIQEMLREARAAKDEAERARRDLESFQRQIQQPAPDVSQMDPEQRLRYERQQSEAAFSARLAQQEFRTEARIDRMAYESKGLASNPRYKKFQDQVERDYQTQLNNAMRQGRPDLLPSRELILSVLIGMEDVKNGDKAFRAAQDKGRKNIAAAQTRPANLAGNVGRSSGGNKSEADAARERMRKAGVLED